MEAVPKVNAAGARRLSWPAAAGDIVSQIANHDTVNFRYRLACYRNSHDTGTLFRCPKCVPVTRVYCTQKYNRSVSSFFCNKMGFPSFFYKIIFSLFQLVFSFDALNTRQGTPLGHVETDFDGGWILTAHG